MDFLITLGGFLGSLLISGAFAMQVRNGHPQWQRLFLYANLAGSLLLIPPAVVHATPLALLLNLFWIVVTLTALAQSSRPDKNSATLPLIKITAAGTLVAAIWSLHQSGYAILQIASTLALVAFMAGYFEITREHGAEGKRFYFGTALAGNILYIPMLYDAGNYPNLSLQACCLIISIYGLAQSRANKTQIA